MAAPISVPLSAGDTFWADADRHLIRYAGAGAFTREVIDHAAGSSPLALVLRTEEVSVKAGAAGHAVLPLSDVRLVDAQNNAVAPGQRGEICVRGPQVMAGYWNNREATNAVIDADGWFHTGDIGQADEDGYVYVVDRLKDMVITGGENVYPAEVEAVLYSHPAIAEVAVLGTPHQQWGEAVTAVVALNSGAALTLDELREFAHGKLVGYKIPLRLEFVDALPAIQLARSSSTSSLHSSPPRHKAKPKLRQVWQPISGLTWAFTGLAGWRSGYVKVSGIAVPRRVKASRWALVGSVSIGMVSWVPVNRTWLRVKVARCSSRPRKL